MHENCTPPEVQPYIVYAELPRVNASVNLVGSMIQLSFFSEKTFPKVCYPYENEQVSPSPESDTNSTRTTEAQSKIQRSGK